jgi:hypothetical protein
MSPEDILYTFGCPDPQYRERPQTYLELWKYEVVTGFQFSVNHH